MEDREERRSKIGVVHDSRLPFPLEELGKVIVLRYVQQAERWFEVVVLDVEEFDITLDGDCFSGSQSQAPRNTTKDQGTISAAQSSILGTTERVEKGEKGDEERKEKRRTCEEWKKEIGDLQGLVLVFLFHTWAYCKPLKNAFAEHIFPSSFSFSPSSLSHLQADSQAQSHGLRKPALLISYGRNDLEWRPVTIPGQEQSTWSPRRYSRKSCDMMRTWAETRGMKVLPLPGQMNSYEEAGRAGVVAFECHPASWREWEQTGRVVIGGQVNEEWERASGTLLLGMTRIRQALETKSGRMRVR